MKQKTVKQKATKHKNRKGPGLQRLIRSAALLLLLPLLAAGCGRDEKKDEGKILEKYSQSMDGVVLIEKSAQEDGICMVWGVSAYSDIKPFTDNDPPYLVLDKYVVEKEAGRFKTGHDLLEPTNLVLTIHDQQSGELYMVTQKELEAALPEELRCAGYSAFDRPTFFEYQGKWYMYFYTQYRDDRLNPWDTSTDTMILIDLEDGEIQTVQRETMKEMYYAADEEYRKSMDIFHRDGFMNANGFREYGISPDDAPYLWIRYCDGEFKPESDVISVEFRSEALPERNKALYAKFPGLEQYKGKEKYRIEIYLTGKPGAEEVFRLFIEDWQEISFEGVIVPAEYSVDGQEHKVESFEDWDKWFSDENYR